MALIAIARIHDRELPLWKRNGARDNLYYKLLTRYGNLYKDLAPIIPNAYPFGLSANQ
jgi:hypothetical protein